MERNILQGHVVTEKEGNSFKMRDGRFKLDIRKRLFPVRMLRP